MKTPKLQPGPTLKALRNRAGVSSAVCAKALGLNGPSGYARYENDKRFLTDPIPYKVIETILPRIAGRGVPPVTESELWAISEVRDLKGLLPKVSQLVTERPTATVTQFTTKAVARTLETRYRAELGVYSSLDGQRKFANAPILPCPTFPIEAQFAVSVGDDHAEEFGIKAGAHVHCLDTGVRPVSVGSIVLATRQVQGGFNEILFARVVGGSPDSWYLSQRSTGQFNGTVLGVAHKAYTPLA